MSLLDDLQAVMLAEVGGVRNATPSLLKKYLSALGYTQRTVIGQMQAYAEDNGMSILSVLNYIASGAGGGAVTVPDAPTIGGVTAGNTQVTVSFSAGGTGGSPITGYTVTSSPGGFTGTGSVSPIIVTGLTNGTPYTFTVVATNAQGNSAPSAASSSVTPATVPGAPTIGTATRGNQQASITFTAPASNGGSAITGYTLTSSPGGFTGTGSASPIVVAGLTNGVSYTFTATATNVMGTSAASAASNAVTPATVPGAPTIGTATAGDTTASITFSAPGSDGGAAITGYTMTSSPGGLTGTGASSPISVTGLTNGVAYTFTVTATNAVGTSAASSASNSVTPEAPSSNLLINGDFDTDTNWTKNSGWTISAGAARKAAGTGGNIFQGYAFTAATYEVTYTVVSISGGSVNCRFINGSGANVTGSSRSAPGTYTQQLTAVDHTNFAINAGAAVDAVIDDIIMTQV